MSVVHNPAGRTRRHVPASILIALMSLAGCAGRDMKPVEDLTGGRDLSRFALTSIKGLRDGDRLDVRAVFADGTAQLRVDLHFAIGSPTRLASGTWSGLGGEGRVQERSLTFLGGQSGPPSIGGRFDLIGPGNSPLYRVTIPVQELKARL